MYLIGVWQSATQQEKSFAIPPLDPTRVQLVSTHIPLDKSDKKKLQYKETDLHDPAFHISPDHSTSDSYTVLVPVNGVLPIMVMSRSQGLRQEFGSWVRYWAQVQLHAINSGQVDDTRANQDSITAAVMARLEPRLNMEDFDTVRYLVQPGQALFVPHGCIFRMGGYLPDDIDALSGEFRVSANTRVISHHVHHLEFILSKSRIPACAFLPNADVRDDPFYFPMANFIPPDHFNVDSVPYQRSKVPIQKWQFQSWARHEVVHSDPWTPDAWACMTTTEQAEIDAGPWEEEEAVGEETLSDSDA